jgi:hypothetical protein
MIVVIPYCGAACKLADGVGFDSGLFEQCEEGCGRVTEFETYIRNNRELIPNFDERRRQGETISTAFVEPTIHQVVSRRFVRKQQMQWTFAWRPPAATDADEGPER